MILGYSLYLISPAGRGGREGGREEVVVIALASHQRGPGSIMDSWGPFLKSPETFRAQFG